MAGYRGLVLGTSAAIDERERFERYRERLTPEQLAVFDGLRLAAHDWGGMPSFALQVMERYGPWPDPFDEPCEDCGK